MATQFYHVNLTVEQREALIQMQYTGSALATALHQNCPTSKMCASLYEDWATLLDVVQPLLWQQLEMGRLELPPLPSRTLRRLP